MRTTVIDLKQHERNLILDRQARDKFDPMAEVLPESQQGVASIDHFTMDPGDMLASLAEHAEDFVPTGRYARLKVNGQLMMTDSPMEKRTNLEVVEKAQGRVLIAGLGLGMILRSLLRKPEVSTILVLEKFQDVVDLVLPSLAGDSLISGFLSHDGNHITTHGGKLEVIVADVFQWEPFSSLRKLNTIYFDIWPDSTVHYLPEMEFLYKRYRPLLAKGGWMDSWTYKKLKLKKRDDDKFNKTFPALLEKHWRERTPEEFLARLRVLLQTADQYILNSENREVIYKFVAGKGLKL